MRRNVRRDARGPGGDMDTEKLSKALGHEVVTASLRLPCSEENMKLALVVVKSEFLNDHGEYYEYGYDDDFENDFHERREVYNEDEDAEYGEFHNGKYNHRLDKYYKTTKEITLQACQKLCKNSGRSECGFWSHADQTCTTVQGWVLDSYDLRYTITKEQGVVSGFYAALDKCPVLIEETSAESLGTTVENHVGNTERIDDVSRGTTDVVGSV